MTTPPISGAPRPPRRRPLDAMRILSGLSPTVDGNRPSNLETMTVLQATPLILSWSGGEIHDAYVPGGATLVEGDQVQVFVSPGKAVVMAPGGGVPDPWPIIAAYDAPDNWKAAATYQCDGVADEVELTQAGLNSEGFVLAATVRLSPGTFIISTPAGGSDFGMDGSKYIGAGDYQAWDFSPDPLEATRIVLPRLPIGSLSLKAHWIYGSWESVTFDVCSIGTGTGITGIGLFAGWNSKFRDCIFECGPYSKIALGIYDDSCLDNCVVERNHDFTGATVDIGSEPRSFIRDLEIRCNTTVSYPLVEIGQAGMINGLSFWAFEDFVADCLIQIDNPRGGTIIGGVRELGFGTATVTNDSIVKIVEVGGGSSDPAVLSFSDVPALPSWVGIPLVDDTTTPGVTIHGTEGL